MQYYTIPTQYGNKSLKQLQSETGYAFRPDVLSGFLGVGEDQPLTSGQTLTANLPSNYANSGESQALQKLFGQGMNEQQYQSNQIAKTQQQQLSQYNQAIQPAISTLQGSVDPLKERYNAVIKSITESRDLAKKQAGVNASQEYAKRGLSLQSSDYGDFLANKVNPIDIQYGGLETQAAGEAQDRESAIKNAIATLQSQGALQGLSSGQAIALAQQVAAQTAKQFDTTNALDQAKFDYTKNQTETPDLSKQYITIPQGNSLFNLLTGKSIYNNPKTYSPNSTGGSGSNPVGV